MKRSSLTSTPKIVKEQAQQTKNWAQDNEFWNAVDELVLGHLSPFLGISLKNVVRSPTSGNQRIVAWIDGLPINHPLQKVYRFLSDSPMYMITYRSYVLTVGMSVDLAYDRHAMLIQLQFLMKEQYSLEMLKQIVPTAVARFGMGGPADGRVKLPADDIVKIRAVTRNVYSRWYDYVKRHTLLVDPDKNSPWKLEALAKTMDCLRAHDIGEYTYSVGSLLSEMFLVDKTLCHALPLNSKTLTIGPMTSNVFRAFASQYGFRPMHHAMLKDILYLRQSQLMKQQKRNSPAPEAAFVYKWQDQQYHVFYNKESDSFSFEKKTQETPFPVSQTLYLSDGPKTSPPKAFLWALSGGNWDAFCMFAKIIACCTSGENLFPGIVFCPKGVSHEFLSALLDIADINTEVELMTHPLSGMLIDRALDQLISCKLAGAKVIFCEDGKKPLRSEQWNRLGKLLRGVTVSAADPILKRKMHQNRMQCIVIGDDRTVKRFQAKNIPLLPMPCESSVPELPSQQIPAEAMPWLKIILPLWGMLLLKKKQRKKVNIVPHTLEVFLNARCEFTREKEAFLPAKQLHKVYLDFCQQHGYQDHLLLKDFNDAMERDYGQKPVRWHRSEKENRLGYWNVRLLPTEKTAEAFAQQECAGRDDFYFRLDQIAREVMQHFPDFPFNELVEI